MIYLDLNPYNDENKCSLEGSVKVYVILTLQVFCNDVITIQIMDTASIVWEAENNTSSKSSAFESL